MKQELYTMGLALLCQASVALAQSASDGGGLSPRTDVPKAAAARQYVLAGAKNLMVSTASGKTYYYLVSAEENPMLRFKADSMVVGGDKYAKAAVKTMRFHLLPRLLLNEDSATFDRTLAVDHGLLALRTTMATGKWNSICVPVNLTGKQLRDAFGEDAQLAKIRGIREGDETFVELDTLSLATDENVLQANNHYLVRPTKEPDVAEGKTLTTSFSAARLKGPIYLFPNVSMLANTRVRVQTYTSSNEQTKIRIKGTYQMLDGTQTLGSIVRNAPLEAGTYCMSGAGTMVQNTEETVLKAFRSWIEDISENPQTLHFYVNGVNEDISEIASLIARPNTDKGGRQSDGAVYDLQGRRVATGMDRAGRLPQGVYNVNGKKVIIK